MQGQFLSGSKFLKIQPLAESSPGGLARLLARPGAPRQKKREELDICGKSPLTLSSSSALGSVP